MSRKKDHVMERAARELLGVPYPPAPPYQGEYQAVNYPAYPAPAPPDVHSVSISVLSSHSATVARAVYASVYNTGIAVSATGEAKREPGDDDDAETGRLLATARALEILAGKLRKRANGRIRNAAAIQRHRTERRGTEKLRELVAVVDKEPGKGKK